MNKLNKNVFIIIFISVIIIALVFHFHNDNKTHVLKEYDTIKKVTKTFEYVIKNGDTIFHGKFSKINSRGVKISEGNYINNSPYGKCVYYYDDGAIESVQFRLGNNQNSEATWYYKNGKIESYIMYDNKGRPVFKIIFDQNGVEKYKGYSLLEIYNGEPLKSVQKKEFLNVGDTLKYKYLIANIPMAKRTLKIENIGAKNSNYTRKVTNKVSTLFEIKEVVRKRGENTIRAIVKYDFDDKEMPALIDTISFKIYVK